MEKDKFTEFNTPFSSIAEILSRAVKQYPDSPALVFKNQSWSYAKLGNLVSLAILKMKYYLNATDGRIAIIGNNHPAYVVAYFAAQFLGLSTVEVRRDEALDTIIKIVEKSCAYFVITDRDDLMTELKHRLHVESFNKFLMDIETTDNGKGDIAELSTFKNDSKKESIIYTSGTTGSAKGVILGQENFCFIAYVVADYLKINKKDRYALILPLCHTYGKSVMLSTFAAGAAVVMIDNNNNMLQLIGKIVEEKCSLLSVVPYHIHVLLKGGNLSKYDLSKLRAITSSGNKLTPSAIDDLIEALPGIQVFSMYGLTESTTRACYVPPEMIKTKKESCGKPLPGVDMKIVGEDGVIVPNGSIGEVLLRGPNIMSGYFEDIKLTADTIVDGWLKTGDLGYIDDDGYLYLEGRKKDLIKCAGERIGPVEIEEVLMEYVGVEEAAVIGRPDDLMGEIVHAYIVPSTSSLKKNELHEHCLKKLNHHKVPYYFTLVDKLPKTETGKVQKYLLAGK